MPFDDELADDPEEVGPIMGLSDDDEDEEEDDELEGFTEEDEDGLKVDPFLDPEDEEE